MLVVVLVVFDWVAVLRADVDGLGQLVCVQKRSLVCQERKGRVSKGRVRRSAIP